MTCAFSPSLTVYERVDDEVVLTVDWPTADTHGSATVPFSSLGSEAHGGSVTIQFG